MTLVHCYSIALKYLLQNTTVLSTWTTTRANNGKTTVSE